MADAASKIVNVMCSVAPTYPRMDVTFMIPSTGVQYALQGAAMMKLSGGILTGTSGNVIREELTHAVNFDRRVVLLTHYDPKEPWQFTGITVLARWVRLGQVYLPELEARS